MKKINKTNIDFPLLGKIIYCNKYEINFELGYSADFNNIKEALQKYKDSPKVKKHGWRKLGNTRYYYLGYNIIQKYDHIAFGCKKIPLKMIDRYIKESNILK